MRPVTVASRWVQLGGAPIRVDDDQPTFWERVEAGRWERGTLAVLGRLLKPQTTFLDLGAWVGPLTLFAAAKGARVVAVEADPAALAQLRRNLAVNPDLARSVEVVAAAVAPESGRVRLGTRRKPGDSMSSSLLAGQAGSWDIEAVTPATLAGLVADAVRLVVKLDIEGGEYALLPALGPLLERPGTALLVSFHPAILAASGDPDPRGTTRRALTSLNGWRASAIGPDGATARPIDPDAIDVADTWLFDRQAV